MSSIASVSRSAKSTSQEDVPALNREFWTAARAVGQRRVVAGTETRLIIGAALQSKLGGFSEEDLVRFSESTVPHFRPQSSADLIRVLDTPPRNERAPTCDVPVAVATCFFLFARTAARASSAEASSFWGIAPAAAQRIAQASLSEIVRLAESDIGWEVTDETAVMLLADEVAKHSTGTPRLAEAHRAVAIAILGRNRRGHG